MALKEIESGTQGSAVDNFATAPAYLHSGVVGQRATEEHRWSQLMSVISMGVIDEKSFTRECITMCLQALGGRFDIVPFATCDDFLQSGKCLDLILYYIHEDNSKWDNDTQKLLSFRTLLNMIPVIILSDNDNLDNLIEMLDRKSVV